MQQAGDDRLAGTGAAADFVGGFQHGDLDAGLGEGDRGGQAVGPGPHDDCGTHSSPPARFGTRSSSLRSASGVGQVFGAFCVPQLRSVPISRYFAGASRSEIELMQ